MAALRKINQLFQKPALTNRLTQLYQEDAEDLEEEEVAPMLLNTVAAKTATKKTGKYPNDPSTCRHPGGLRGYNAPAKGGVRSNYRICDLCGSRWQQQGEKWIPIEPRSAPGARSPPGPAPPASAKKAEAWTGRPASTKGAASSSEPSDSSSRRAPPCLRTRRTRVHHRTPTDGGSSTHSSTVRVEATHLPTMDPSASDSAATLSETDEEQGSWPAGAWPDNMSDQSQL